MASPVWRPIRVWNRGIPSFAHFCESSLSRTCISRAVAQALRCPSSIRIGAPKNHITASHIYLSRVPPCVVSISVISERYSLMSVNIFSVQSCSEIVVNPAISENITVISLFSPPSLSIFGFFDIFFTTSGDI